MVWRFDGKPSINRIKTVSDDAFGKYYQFEILILDYLLERLMLTASMADTPILYIEQQLPYRESNSWHGLIPP